MDHPVRHPRGLCQLLVGLFAFIACLAVAHTAWADYSIDKVSIDATIGSDGTLSVIEDRTFDFDGSYHGVYWKLPEGTYEGAELTPHIASVGIVEDGVYTEFAHNAGGIDGSFDVTDEGSYLEVKLYSAHEDESATFRIVYSYPDLAQRYEDVGELYWKFVSDGWDVASDNVTCTVHLPVPSGESVEAGSNVRAWGHGPLDASLAFDGSAIVYAVPGVGTDEYAEARIVFPESWLSGATQRSGEVLDSVMSEEQAWADEANAKRERARTMSTVALVGSLALAALFIALSVHAYLRDKREHRPQFDDEYFRDVPTDDHPAVLDALRGDGKPDGNALPASIMRLCDLGYVQLGCVVPEKKGFLGKKKRERYYLDLVKRPAGTDAADEIDARTLLLLFDEIEGMTDGDAAPSGQPRLWFSSIEKAAKDAPERYSDAIEKWEGAVTGACSKKNYILADNPNKKVPYACCALSIVLAGILIFLGIAEKITAGVAFAGLAAAVAAAVVSGSLPQKMCSKTPEGIEVEAKLEALRRWLLDFTRLKEAVPQDVVLWNRLLVMAVVLGVSEKVIAQLKVAAPELYETLSADPYSPWYWYAFWGPGYYSTPMDAFGKSVESAHSVSTAALAKSMESSGGGFGGGFSGGGGGGFGGGGGGGAF